MQYYKLYDLRESKGMTQKECAELLDLHVNVYARYERQERDLPSSVLIKLSKLYNVSTDYILGLKDKTTR